MKDNIFGLIKKAEDLRGRARYSESLKLYKTALSLSKKRSDLDGILDSTLSIADIYRMTGNFDDAIRNYEDALEACDALGNKLTAADCMVGIGLSLRAIGMWRESIKFILSARRVYKKEKDVKGLAFSVWAEAGALRVAGEAEKAIEKFDGSRKIFSSIKFKSGVAYALCGLGGTHRITGKYKESLKYYMESNRMFAVMKDKFGTAYSYCGIGNAYRMANNYSEAMKYFKKAERLYEEIGDRVSYSYTLWSIANVHKMKNNIDGARASIRKALGNFKKTKDPRGVIYCNMTIGEVEYMEGRHGAAEKRILSALNSAARHDFKLEKCHAETLLMLMGSRSSGAGPMPYECASCYKKIGVNLKAASIPFNMP